jgi:hypothetical protein
MNTYFENLRTRKDLTSGEIRAYQAYKDDFILDSFLWEREVKDFVNTLREGGVKSFVYVSSSTAVMGNFHSLIENGCKFVEIYIGENGEKGLRFEVL